MTVSEVFLLKELLIGLVTFQPAENNREVIKIQLQGFRLEISAIQLPHKAAA